MVATPPCLRPSAALPAATDLTTKKYRNEKYHSGPHTIVATVVTSAGQDQVLTFGEQVTFRAGPYESRSRSLRVMSFENAIG